MNGLIRFVENVSRWLYWVAGASLASMMFLTVADVILRTFKRPILGTYELVGFLGALTVGFAIPQTSLDKGHVFMDFLTERIKGTTSRVLFLSTRLLGIVLFAIIGWNLLLMGNDLLAKQEVSLTLHLPQFPLAYGISLCCLVECLVLLTDMIRKEGA